MDNKRIENNIFLLLMFGIERCMHFFGFRGEPTQVIKNKDARISFSTSFHHFACQKSGCPPPYDASIHHADKEMQCAPPINNKLSPWLIRIAIPKVIIVVVVARHVAAARTST